MKPVNLIKRILSVLGWTLILMALAVVALFALEPTVSLDYLAPRVARLLSDTLGRPVALTEVTCRVALEPEVTVGSLQVRAREPGETNLVAVTGLRFTTSLPALLADTVRIRDASVGEVTLVLPAAKGEDAVPAGDGAKAALDVPPIPDFPLIDIQGLSVDRLALQFDAGGRRESATMSGIEFEAPLVGSSRLAFHAGWHKHTAEVSARGGNLNGLLRGALLWPVRLEVTTDRGAVNVGAMVRGAPFPRQAGVELNAVVQDLRLDGILPERMHLDHTRTTVYARWDGLTLPDMLSSFEMQSLDDGVGLTLTPVATGEVQQVSLDHTVIAWQSGDRLVLLGEGRLLGETFHVDAQADPLSTWPPAGAIPFRVRAAGAGARVHLSGSWDGAADRERLLLRADVQGDRVGDLAAWFGFSEEADMPYRAAGAYRQGRGEAILTLEEVYLGATRLAGWAKRKRGEQGWEREIDLAFERLDLGELSRLSGGTQALAVEDAGQKEEAKQLRLDVPILPANTRLPDADLEIKIAEVRSADGTFEKVHSRLLFRDGWLERSPFSLEAGQSVWTGECFLDAREEVPIFGVELSAEEVAVDQLVPVLADDPDLSVLAGHVIADIEVEGATIRQMLTRNRILMKADDVRIELGGDGEEPARIGIPRLSLLRPALGDALIVEAQMTRGERSARIQGQLGAVPPAEGKDLGLSLDGTFSTEDTELLVAGKVWLPFRSSDIDLDIHLVSREPSWFTGLIGLDWEPVAPLEVAGQITGKAGRYEVRDLEATLNRSRLAGQARVQFGPEELAWRVEGRCETLHLDDLGMVKSTNEVTDAEAPEALEAAETEPADGTRRMVGELALQVDQVFFDGEALGGGAFGLRMEPGRITLQPVHFASEDRYGDVFFGTEKLLPGGETNRWDVGVTATNLPINLLSLLSPELSAALGVVYADVEVRSPMPKEDPRFMAHLDGELGFAVFPANIRPRFLDYWAVGAVQALGMTLTGQGDSKVECIAGRLRVEDGLAKPYNTYIDTSRMRVKCTGWIDFDSGKLHLKLKPRPKGMAFISLATPVEVTGTLQDPDIQVSTKAVAGTVVRVYFWFVTAIDSLFRKNIPEHDHEGYMRMMSGEKP